jgi:hypothetical protein
MKQLRKTLAGRLGDFALFAGAALTSTGAGMIYEPAGVICAGALLMIGAILAGGSE